MASKILVNIDSVPNHYKPMLTYYCQAPRNRLQWKMQAFCSQENTFENTVCKMAAISFSPLCVDMIQTCNQILPFLPVYFLWENCIFLPIQFFVVECHDKVRVLLYDHIHIVWYVVSLYGIQWACVYVGGSWWWDACYLGLYSAYIYRAVSLSLMHWRYCSLALSHR